MAMVFKNLLRQNIEFVFVMYDSTIHDFVKVGWYELPAGGSIQVVDGDLQNGNQYYYCSAQSTVTGGTDFWTGPITLQICSNAFKRAVWDNTGCDETAGFFEIDINGDNDLTLEFTP